MIDPAVSLLGGLVRSVAGIKSVRTSPTSPVTGVGRGIRRNTACKIAIYGGCRSPRVCKCEMEGALGRSGRSERLHASCPLP